MRTTIDIPDELLRRTKAAAALRGLKLKDFVASLLEQGLQGGQSRPEALGRRRPIPVSIPGDFSELTHERIESALTAEEVESVGRS